MNVFIFAGKRSGIFTVCMSACNPINRKLVQLSFCATTFVDEIFNKTIYLFYVYIIN